MPSDLNIDAKKIKTVIDLLESYLKTKLLPFWLDNSIDEKYGGFLSYFDRQGKPTGKTDKTLICQLRLIFTMASAHRAGYGGEASLKAAKQGVQFVVDHFWDREYSGWYWVTDRKGAVLDDSKIMYGQSFGIYAMAEYGLASNDFTGRDYAVKTLHSILENAVDTIEGGYWEMFYRDWSFKPPGVYGGDRKTLDVHMHLMEALTSLYALTGLPAHARKLREIIHILTKKMLDPKHGTGMAQFDRQFQPLPAILFKDVWGCDRPAEGDTRPLNNTNYGHNIEFAWLLNHALHILTDDAAPYMTLMHKLSDHALRYGVDWEYGGIYVEGPYDGPATQTVKEFWQQAEAMTGFIDMAVMFREMSYWDGFENLFHFIWDKMINHDVGEWYALLERDGTVKWDHLGHEWKISYHTVRSVIQTLDRLRKLFIIIENQ